LLIESICGFSQPPSPKFGDVICKEKNFFTFAYQHVPYAIKEFLKNILFLCIGRQFCTYVDFFCAFFVPQSQQLFPVEVSAIFIFFFSFYGASAHFRAMASPISLLQPCLFLAATAASVPA